MNKDRINLVLDEDLSNEAERAARVQRTTKTAYIRIALMEKLAKDGYFLPVPAGSNDVIPVVEQVKR